MIKKIGKAIWLYYVGMTSEKGGEPSIKRGMAWGLASLVVFVEVATVVGLFMLAYRNPQETIIIDTIEYLSVFYVAADLITVLLALRITSIEKLGTVAGQLKSGLFGGTTITNEKPKED